MTSFYEVLGCDKDATDDELKRNYQQLIKLHHPDKGGESAERFIKIDMAWKTLRDKQSRKAYDASLWNHVYEENQLIHAELSAGDLLFNEQSVATYPCRCGESFAIEKKDLIGDECLFECYECSNCIIVNNK